MIDDFPTSFSPKHPKSKYLAGDDLTLADLAIGIFLNHVFEGGLIDLSSYKHIETWHKSLRSLDGWIKNNEVLVGLINKYK